MKKIIPIIFFSIILAQPEPEEIIFGYLRASEVSVCMDECGEYYVEHEIQDGPPTAVIFMDGIDFSLDSGMRVVFMEEFFEIGVKEVIKEALKVVGDGPTYISFDVDGLDPVFAPGTGTPEVGGITTVEAQTLLRGLKGRNLIGADVVEVAPPFDQTGNTALVGATMMYEILCLLADRFR